MIKNVNLSKTLYGHENLNDKQILIAEAAILYFGAKPFIMSNKTRILENNPKFYRNQNLILDRYENQFTYLELSKKYLISSSRCRMICLMAEAITRYVVNDKIFDERFL